MTDEVTTTAGWIVRTPERQEGSIVHPAEEETLLSSDGWDEEAVLDFCEVNHAHVIGFQSLRTYQTEVPQGYVGER